MKMTKQFILSLLCLFVCSVCDVSAETVDFNFTTTEYDVSKQLVSDIVVLQFAKGEGSNSPKDDGKLLKFYYKNTLEITAGGYRITKVVVESVADKNLTQSCFNGVGGSSYNSDKSIMTWTCGADAVYTLNITQKVSTYRQIKSISVTYDTSEAAIRPESPVFSVEGGEVEKGTEVIMTSATEGAEVFYTLDQSEPTQKSQKGDRVVISQPLTIKAIAVLGGIVSEVSSASFTVRKSSADGVEGFVKVTDQSMLEDGDVLIILNEEYQVALGKTGKNNRDAVPVVINNGVVQDIDDAVELITLEETGKYWRLKSTSGYFYAKGKTSNYLQTNEQPQDNFSKAEISFTDGDAVVKFCGGASYRSLLSYNATAELFSCYFGGQSAVQIYKKTEVEAPDRIDLTMDKSGYTTLYYGDKSLVVPSGITAQTYKMDGDELVVSKTYHAGEVIPVATGVVLQGEPKSYCFEIASADGERDAENMLKGTDEDAMTEGEGLFYKLSTYNDSQVGFYWGAAEGAAFMNMAHKAYLVVPSMMAAKSFMIDGTGDTDGITDYTIPTDGRSLGNSDRVYDLHGRRMSTSGSGSSAVSLQRGIYIVNGKKMIIQ